MPEVPFDILMERLRCGDEAAAEEVFRRFAGRLISLARAHLDSRLRQKEDPEEIANSALKSFFLRYADGQFELDNWDGLWALLTIITLRKCGLRAEHWRTQRRDVAREAAPPGDSRPDWEVLAREPTPSEAAMLAETVERLLGSLDEYGRQVVELSLEGYSVLEISARLDLSERTIYRILERVRSQLQRMSNEAHEPPKA